MIICILADEQQKKEISEKGIPAEVEVVWADTMKVLYSVSDTDAYFDLQYNEDTERTRRLQRLRDRPVFINDVVGTLRESDPSFIRINAWPSMINRSLTEIAVNDHSREEVAISTLNTLQWKAQVVPDVPGMITPRILCTIINEAYFTLEQGVSSREEIDVAMKLGTNYPMGPFEWSQKIGLKNVHRLLDRLSRNDSRYLPCDLLSQEVFADL